MANSFGYNMAKLYMQGITVKDPARSIIIHTGMGGARMFDRAIQVEVLTDKIKDLRKGKKITVDESTRLKQMIDSPDNESFEMAKIIIDVKEKEKPTKRLKLWR